MIGILPDIPPNVAGFRASGDVTREDYKRIVFPEIRKHVESFGQLNFVFFVDTSLKNFSAGAWIRDIWLGVKELARWHKVAIISDVEKVRNFTNAISRLLPGTYRGFPASRLAEAIRWASNEGEVEDEMPDQMDGRSLQASAQVKTHHHNEARYVFNRAVERLQDVNQWTDLCGSLMASYQLLDDSGHPLEGRVTKGDFIRVDIPDQGKSVWVQVDRMERLWATDMDEQFIMQMRLSDMPKPLDGAAFGAQPEGKMEEQNTRVILVERKEKRVSVCFFSGSVNEAARIQWNALVQGLLEKE